MELVNHNGIIKKVKLYQVILVNIKMDLNMVLDSIDGVKEELIKENGNLDK